MMSVVLRLARLSVSPCPSIRVTALFPAFGEEPGARNFATNTDRNPYKFRKLYEKKPVPFLGYRTNLPFSIDTYLDDEAVSKLPPHLQPKYLPKKLQHVIEKRKAVIATKSGSNPDFMAYQAGITSLSSRIDVINDHIEKFPKDKKAKADRRIVKFKRKKVLRFLKRNNFALYEELKQKFGLEELDVCIDPYTYLNRHKIFKKGKRIDIKKEE